MSRPLSLSEMRPINPFFCLPAPCPPAAINATVDCSNQGNATIKISIKIVIRLSWLNTVLHTATAMDHLGRSHTCSTADSSCDIHSLRCGTEYNVTVTSSRDGCAGPPSEVYTVKTGQETQSTEPSLVPFGNLAH